MGRVSKLLGSGRASDSLTALAQVGDPSSAPNRHPQLGFLMPTPTQQKTWAANVLPSRLHHPLKLVSQSSPPCRQPTKWKSFERNMDSLGDLFLQATLWDQHADFPSKYMHTHVTQRYILDSLHATIITKTSSM